jgi:hypothetical protein
VTLGWMLGLIRLIFGLVVDLGIAAMDLFVVPTVSFRLLYGLLIMGHGRRQILCLV